MSGFVQWGLVRQGLNFKMVKILGYIDDAINWQIGLSWYWNIPVMTVELFIIIYIWSKFRSTPPFVG